MCLVLINPFIFYKLFTPEIRKVENYKEISREGLKDLGRMTVREKFLTAFFVGAVLLWATTGITGFNATAVAILFLAMCLIFGCMTWNDVRQRKGAWDTLIWYGAIIGLSSAGFTPRWTRFWTSKRV